jgi:hypothetical protein
MLMFLKNLGKDYIVWDKKACIEFIKATSDDVYAEFIITDEVINQIKEELSHKRSMEKTFNVLIKTKSNQEIVAKVDKILYFRRLNKT